MIFTFSSKNLTRGLAINAMIQPATNGAKNTNLGGYCLPVYLFGEVVLQCRHTM